jgi:hypothetical protein
MRLVRGFQGLAWPWLLGKLTRTHADRASSVLRCCQRILQVDRGEMGDGGCSCCHLHAGGAHGLPPSELLRLTRCSKQRCKP